MQVNETEEKQADNVDSLKTMLKDSKDHKVELVLKREEEPKEEEIDIRALVIKMLRGKKVIAFMTLLAFVLSTLGSLVYVLKQDYKGTASSIISFNFQGVDRGLDPLGKTFDITEVKDAKVLEKTIQELGLAEKGITVDGLKRNLAVSGIMPEDIMKKVLIINRMAEKDASKLEKLTDLEYHPVEYKLDLTFPRDFSVNASEARQILNSITNNYKEYFLEKYSDRQALNTAVNKIDFQNYDYPEFVILAQSQLNSVKSYIRLKANQSPDFRAKATQMTFGDILAQISVLEDIDLNRIQSVVNSFMLTKDAEELIAIYENSIIKKKLDVIKKEEQAKGLREQASSYKKDTSIMLIPGANNTETTAPVEVNKTSITYDKLVESATGIANEASQLKADIAYYEQLLLRLNSKIEAGVVQNEVQVQKYRTQVEKQAESFTKSLSDIIALTNNTVDEYFETEVFKDAVKINVPASYASSMRESLKTVLMIIMGGTFFGLMVGLLVALGKDILKERDNNHSTSL